VKIKSEHVARVIDVGTLENGAPYMVMEYLDGGDLAQVVQARGPLPVEEAVEYVLQACEAIAHAHVLGIVHRDLKPANLFLIRRPDGTNAVKVLDFGISKVMPGKGSSSDNAMTRTRAIMGSPLYMSPEQMTSTRDVDGRTDIWALGVILYELLSGQPPFSADTMPQLCGLILSGPTPSIRTVRPNIPPGLDAVLRRSLEKDPARRYPNIAEFASALAEFAPKRARVSIDRVGRVIQSSSMTNSGVVIAGTPGGAVQTGDPWAETKQGIPTTSSKKALWIALAATVVLVAIAVFILRRPPPAVEATVLARPTVLPAALPSVAPPPAVEAPAPPAAGAPSSVSSNAASGAHDVVAPPPKAEPPKTPSKRAPTVPAHNAAAAPPAPAPSKPSSSDLFDDRK
jgi:serine/threonine-protein kinase